MNSQSDEVYLSDYFRLILKHIWLIAVVFIGVIAATWFTAPPAREPLYDTNVSLLLVLSPKVPLDGVQVPGVSLYSSQGAVSSFALNSSLLTEIISRLNLKEKESGSTLGVISLSEMMELTVQTGVEGTSLLINLRVRGEEPRQIIDIADTWADVFAEQNGVLFSSEAERSYVFADLQFNQAEAGLALAEGALRDYSEEFTIFIMKDELALKERALSDYRSTFLNSSAKLDLSNEAYRDVLSNIDELTLDGKWIGVLPRAEVSKKIPDLTVEQEGVLRITEQLFDFRQELQEFGNQKGISLIAQKLSLEKEQFGKYRKLFAEAESDAEALSVALESLETAIESEDRYLVTVKALDDAALFQQLGVSPSAADWEAVRSIGLRTEVVNPVFVELALNIVVTRADAVSNRELASFLDEEILASQATIEALEEVLADNRNEQLARFADQGKLLLAAYDTEQNNFSDLQIRAIKLRNEIRELQTSRDRHALLIEGYIEDVERLTTQIPGVESQLKKFYNGLQSSQNNVDNWRDRLRNAVVWKEVSKAEGSNNILILESAEEPKKPIKMTNVLLFRLVIGAALGLVLGVLAAFLFSYMRGVNREEQET